MTKITGTLEIQDHSWTWKANKNLGVADLDFLDKVNPSFSLVFKKHILGADACEKHITDYPKFLKCIRAVNQA